MKSKDRPYVLYVAEKIYLEISKIKKENKNFSNINAVENFIGTDLYKEISSGKFHDLWFEKLKNQNFINKENNNKIPDETIRLLHLQKDIMVRQLTKFPDLYYSKNNFPLKISKRAFEHLWRICENYELWCIETKQRKLLKLNIIDQK